MSSSALAQINYIQPQWQPPDSLRWRPRPFYHSPVHAAAVLLDGFHQGGLCGVSISVGMCLQLAPDKTVHWVEVRAARRPAVLRESRWCSPPATWYTSITLPDMELSPAAIPRAFLQHQTWSLSLTFYLMVQSLTFNSFALDLKDLSGSLQDVPDIVNDLLASW